MSLATDTDVRARTVRLSPHVRAVRRSDNEILVSHGTRSLFTEVFSDNECTGVLGVLAERLRAPASVDALVTAGHLRADQAGAAVDAVVGLLARGVLVPAEVDGRQAYLSSVFDRVPLAESLSVAVVGSGRLARHIAERLGQDLTGATDSTAQSEVELLPGRNDIEFAEVFAGRQFVVVALDEPSTTVLHAANDAALVAGIPWMSVYLDGSEGIVGPSFIPGESPCYFEFEAQTEAGIYFVDHALELKHARSAGGTDTALPACYLDIVAGYAVASCLRHLLGGIAFTTGRAVRLDLERMEIDTQNVLRIPRCPACGPHRPAVRNPFL